MDVWGGSLEMSSDFVRVDTLESACAVLELYCVT